MIDTSYLLMSIAIILWVIFRVVVLVKRKKKTGKTLIGKEIMLNLFVLYIICLISVTLLPLVPGIYGNRTLIEKACINYIPFIEYRNIIDGFEYFTFRAIVGNIILLVPFIAYLNMYNNKIRTKKNSLLAAFGMSLTIELLQLIENLTNLTFPSRTVNIDDLIFNTVGALIGYGIFKLIHKTKLKKLLNIG